MHNRKHLMRRFFSLFLFLSLCAAACAQPGCPALSDWTPAAVVSETEVESFGLDSCFCAQPLDAKLLARIDGRSWKSHSPLSRADLRYLKVLHRNAAGEIQLGEMICHKDIADDLLDIFRKLYDAGYIIERMVLVDDYDADDEASMAADNSSCFNTRFIGGTTRLSKHGLGMAVDINPLYNPYVKISGGKTIVSPESGRPYAFDRDSRDDIPYKIDRNDLCCRLFLEHGFTWGGDWTSLKDYQHFEK